MAAAAVAEGTRRITMTCNIQSIKAAIHMEEYAARYVDFKRGAAKCPFHEEKTASFCVKGEFFKCFGCGAGGSVIRFVMSYENLDFVAAAKKLAERGGIKLVDAAAGMAAVTATRRGQVL